MTIHEKLTQSHRAKVNGHVERSESRKPPESIDFAQGEILQANQRRMSSELYQKWKPISMQLVAEAENMIEANHYASTEVSQSLFAITLAGRTW